MTKYIYVCGIGLFWYVHFWKIHARRCIEDFVNKTSRYKGGAWANEKRKWCNRISLDITLGRNYPSEGYRKSINRLLNSLVVECWLRMWEVPPVSIPSLVPLFSTQHWKGKYWLFLKVILCASEHNCLIVRYCFRSFKQL